EGQGADHGAGALQLARLEAAGEVSSRPRSAPAARPALLRGGAPCLHAPSRSIGEEELVMVKGVLVAVTIQIMVWGSIGSADAAGVYDGIWVVTISSATDSQTLYVSINQNDSFLSAGFNVVMLSVRFGHAWGAATAILSGTLAYGSLYDSTPAPT